MLRGEVRAEVATEEAPAAAVGGAVDAVAVDPGEPRRRAVREGGAHVDEGAVRDAVAGDEDGRLAADPERHDRAMGGVEAPKNLIEGSDGGRVAE